MIYWWEKELINKVEEIIEKERFWSPCSGCEEGHPSFWKTVIESPQWKQWQREQHRRLDEGKIKDGVYDMSEVEECGWISQKHFQDFINFIIKREIK